MSPLKSSPILILLILVVFGFSSCSSNHFNPRAADDFTKLERSGELRILLWAEPNAQNSTDPLWRERQKARDLALYLGLKPVFIHGNNYQDMLKKLGRGQVDLVAGRDLSGQKNKAYKSVPYLMLDEVLVVKKARRNRPYKSLKSFGNRVLCYRANSPQAQLASRLQLKWPKLKTKKILHSYSTNQILKEVELGSCGGALVDSLFWRKQKKSHRKLFSPYRAAKNQPLAFALRPNSKILHLQVNNFLFSQALARRGKRHSKVDLAGIKRQKNLRMITRNNNMTFFIHRGGQLGFEYELIQRFAKSQGLKLEVVNPSYHSDLIPWLKEGKGDLIAAAMTITPKRAKEVRFTRPYLKVQQWIIAKKTKGQKTGIEALTGATISIRKSSAFLAPLKKLQGKVKGLKIEFLPEDMETEDILEKVEAQEIAFAVADSNLAKAQIRMGRKLTKAYSLGSSELAWAVRKNNPQLLKALNRFIAKESRSGYFKILREKYFYNRKVLAKSEDAFRSDLFGQISPYDAQVKQFADPYNLDWRLIVSQMYQESRFDPKKRSSAGAQGLMQVMPRTAKEMGLKKGQSLHQPEAGLRVGVKYMARLFRHFDDVEQLRDRIYFTLASYNAGQGHVKDARILARKLGYSGEIWFGQVEKSIRLLAQPKYYKKARYGYCRGAEPANYVTDIQSRYSVYVEHIPSIHF